MSSITLASNFIDGAWWPSGTFADFGHLQIVLGDVEIEVQAPNPLSIPFGGDWLFPPLRTHSVIDNTPNYGNAEYYATTEVGLNQEQTSGYVWELLVQLRDAFSAAPPIDYNYSQNSNSFVNTLFYVVGINLSQYLGDVTLPSMDNGLPGADRNVLFDLVGSASPISLQLSGTEGNDIIRTGLGDDNLSGSGGNDTIRASAGNDTVIGGYGYDSLYGGSNDDLLTENFDVLDQEDGGALYGGSGNDTIRVSISDDKSSLYGGSGDDTLLGNGASILYGGSGADEFHIETTSTVPGTMGDTIVGSEGRDSLWIDGIEITENNSSVIFGQERGDANPYFTPFRIGSHAISVVDAGSLLTAPIAVVFRIVGMASDSTGKVTDIIYDVFIFKDVSILITDFGATTSAERFNLADAVAVLHDFRQGDFGLFGPLSDHNLPVLHNSYSVLGRIVGDGIDYRYGFGLERDDPRVLAEDVLLKEQAVEAYQEKMDGGGGSTSSSNGTGGGGDELLSGNDNSGSFSGGGGNDIIVAAGGADTADGGTGADLLSGGMGADSLAGGDGNDVVFGDWNPADSEATTSGQNADIIFGGLGTDFLSGDDGADTLSGDTENDILFGGTGADSLLGGENDDSVDGGTENDIVMGEAGNDIVLGGDGTDTVYGGSGNDTVRGNDGQDSVFGDAGNDSVFGGAGNDALFGGDGDDTLIGASGNDVLTGGAGEDGLQGGAGQDSYNYAYGDGNDLIFDSGSYLDIDTINFADIASTSVQFSRVNNDLVIYIHDGSKITIQNQFRVSNESVELAYFSDGMTINLVTVTDPAPTHVLGTIGDDYLFGVNSTTAELIDGLAGNDSIDAYGGNDILYGGIGDDTLRGGSGADLVYGGAGNDIVDGGTGSDTLFGGSGNDIFVVTSTTDLATEIVGEGTDLVQSSVNWTLGVELENLTLTGTSGIAGAGNATANILTGNTGGNALSGGAGNDTLDGGAGTDALDGGVGDDTFIVDVVTDTIVELTAGGNDFVLASLTWTLEAELENLTLTGIAAINGTGNSVANVLTGNTGTNALYGGESNDTLNGGTGDDTLNGGTGNDSMIGGTGDDVIVVDVVTDIVSEASGEGTDTVQSSISYTLGSNVEALTLTGSTAINGTGNTLANMITGNGAANLLSGAAGNDTIAAGAGNDRIAYTSGDDLILGNTSINSGTDILDLLSFAAADVWFTINGHDVVITTPDGAITLQYQVRYELGHVRSNIEQILFADGVLDEAAIKNRALADQATAGNDVIIGTLQADEMRGLAGNDTLLASAGNDTISFDSGNDVIVGVAAFNTGQDTLDLSQYAANDVSFRVVGYDVMITTPDGTIRLEYQVRYAFGHERSNIESIIFSDGSLDEAAIKGRALSDQGTLGNDVMTGTSLNDVLDGRAGNDTITGGAGADVFVFGAGAGKDNITDFALAADHIRFSGHVFSDLTITQSDANALVAFGVNDVMTLVGITASNITAAQFDFV